MNPTRRGFLQSLLSGAAGIVVADPVLELVERALWTPKTQIVVPGGMSAFNELLKEYYLPAVQELLNSKSVLSRYLRVNGRDQHGRDVEETIRLRVYP